MSKESATTSEMIDEFSKIRNREKSIKQAARDVGCPYTSFWEKYRKWIDTSSPAGDTASAHQSARTTLAGISLSHVRSTTIKPAETCRARFFELAAGKAYVLADAAREWGVSPDTLRKHAKDLGAFIYIEVSPENWQPAIIKPKGGAK